MAFFGKKNNNDENINSAQGSSATIAADMQTFMQLISEQSMHMPVVFAFIHYNSPACASLIAKLENVIATKQLPVQLATVDMEKNMPLIQQLGIQSAPTVMAFFKGQPLDGFEGDIDDKKIFAFFSKIMGQELQDPKEAANEALAIAKEAIENQNYEQAVGIAGQVLQGVPDFTPAIAVLIEAYFYLNGIDAANAIIEQLGDEQLSDEHIAASIKKITMLKNAPSVNEIEELKASLQADSNNKDIMLQLAESLSATANYADAIEMFLKLYTLDKNYQDGIAKTKLLELFDILGHEHELTISGRRKLSTLLW